MMLKKHLQQVVDWRKVDKDLYLQAMERSPINDLELRALLQPALTDRTEDRDVIFQGNRTIVLLRRVRGITDANKVSKRSQLSIKAGYIPAFIWS